MSAPESDGYFEYQFDAEHQAQAMAVHFVPTEMFILNVTNADFYLHIGSLKTPSPDNFDLHVPPNSYYTFIPQEDVQEFGGFLDNPAFWQCYVMFRKGSASLMQTEGNYPFPDLSISLSLAPMPDPTVTADFTFVVL